MIPPLVLTAIGWLRSLTWRQVLIGLATLGAAFLYWKGRSDERKAQRIEDLEGYADVRRKADEAKQDAARAVGALSDDELDERLRRKGALRD